MITLKKELPIFESEIPGYEKTFIPLYKLYQDNECIGTYLNIYEAAKAMEHWLDISEITMEYEKDPNGFDSVLKVE